MRRLAADRHGGPGYVLRGASPVDDDLLPRHFEHLRRNAGEVDARMRAEIADAGLDVQLPLRLNRHQAVVTGRSRAVRPHRDTQTADFRAAALARERLPFFPLEQFSAPVERLLDEGARRVGARAI